MRSENPRFHLRILYSDSYYYRINVTAQCADGWRKVSTIRAANALKCSVHTQKRSLDRRCHCHGWLHQKRAKSIIIILCLCVSAKRTESTTPSRCPPTTWRSTFDENPPEHRARVGRKSEWRKPNSTSQPARQHQLTFVYILMLNLYSMVSARERERAGESHAEKERRAANYLQLKHHHHKDG